ncbi:hypothetical protein N665_2827s0008 [Sinapis alba]|nr:hypothetical protein N665_2827s0008 [Sinapis alba]
MGRYWSWLGGGKNKSSSKSKKDIKTTPPSSSPSENTATAAGCMSGVFNIFDLQHLQFPINHHHLHLPKGVDGEETPFSPTRKDGNLNISMGFKIKTKPQARSSSASSSLAATESYSPSVKTPTLVARLMGLDLVPDDYIPSPTPSSSSSSHTNKHRHHSYQRNSIDGGTRSLPETPRISLGRRSVDVNSYQHQRSSLHRDKENQSPRGYARQIVMQLKENVSRRRRMGTDITNREQQSREVHEPKKTSKITNVAPKTMETRVKVQDEPRLQTELQGTEQDEKQSKSATKRKKAENFKSRLVKPPQKMQEELFVRSPATSNKDSSKLRETQSSRNRASTPKAHIAPIAKRTLVLEDIGGFMAGEFPETATQSELAFEGEGIVAELERGILEVLVAETAADYYATWIENGTV